MTRRITIIMAVIGTCVLTPLSSSAVGIASHPINNTGIAVLAAPFEKVSSFADGYAANRFIHTKSSMLLSSADFLAAPYRLFISEPENNTSLWEAYGMMLASLALMSIIAYRRLTSAAS
jgi:hypothetical protein